MNLSIKLVHYTVQKLKFLIKVLWPNPQKSADLATFTEELLNGKLHFVCSVVYLS